MGETEFLNDCLNKADERIKRAERDRDRWRSLLVRCVGELNAETMFREAPRDPT